jgi:hypothetical protein
MDAAVMSDVELTRRLARCAALLKAWPTNDLRLCKGIDRRPEGQQVCLFIARQFLQIKGKTDWGLPT